MDDPLVSIVVPAYNEAATIEEVLRRLSAVPFRSEVIVVDDGSTDGTRRPRRRRRWRAPHPPPAQRGQGRGRPRRDRRHDAARSSSSRMPTSSTTPRTCRAARAAARGPRRRRVRHAPARRRAQRAHLFWHYAGNRFLSLLTNVLFNTTISDMEVGYKAFRGDLIRGLHLVSDDFRFEPEVTAKVLRDPRHPPLRGPDLLLRAHVRRGQEDHVARRGPGRGRPCALSPAGLRRRPACVASEAQARVRRAPRPARPAG